MPPILPRAHGSDVPWRYAAPPRLWRARGANNAGTLVSGAVYVFTRSGTTWVNGRAWRQRLCRRRRFRARGVPVRRYACGGRGPLSRWNETRCGRGLCFRRRRQQFGRKQAKLKASDDIDQDQMGWAVAVYSNLLAVGSRYTATSGAGLCFFAICLKLGANKSNCAGADTTYNDALATSVALDDQYAGGNGTQQQ